MTSPGVIVLAAGRGTRMKSSRPKVFHQLLGRTMLDQVLSSARGLCPRETIVVMDPTSANLVEERPNIRTAIQRIPLGTADAVATGVDALECEAGPVLILNGDVPLIRAESLRSLLNQHMETGATLTLATFTADAKSKYGSIRRRDGRVVGVVEAVDDDRDGLDTVEANGGVYVFDLKWLREEIGNVSVSASGEYYLTSLVSTLARSKDCAKRIETVELDEVELLGIDDRRRLAQAEQILRRRVLDQHMDAGVTIVDPERTVIEQDVEINPDVRIEPGCFIRGATIISSGALIGPYSVIEDSHIGRDARVLQSWVIESRIGDRVRVGPFSRLRPGSSIDADVHIGNFVETKATRIGSGSHVHHFSYLGDAELGRNVNVGAGTITCNYDGLAKHRTVIGNDVFVGSDTMLVAPVELGNGSKTGAGAVVTRSVAPGKTVVGIPARPIERSVENTQGEHGR